MKGEGFSRIFFCTDNIRRGGNCFHSYEFSVRSFLMCIRRFLMYVRRLRMYIRNFRTKTAKVCRAQRRRFCQTLQPLNNNFPSGQGTGPCPAFSIFFKNICQKSVSDSSGDKQCNYTTLKQRGGYDERSICTKHRV